MALIHRLQAAAELLARYRQAWRHAWQHRDTLTPPPHTRDEAEFLPAALALQAEPTSPTARWVARLIVLGVVGVLAWALLGHTEIIVNAAGRIVPRGQSKTVAVLVDVRGGWGVWSMASPSAPLTVVSGADEPMAVTTKPDDLTKVIFAGTGEWPRPRPTRCARPLCVCVCAAATGGPHRVRCSSWCRLG